MYNWEKSKHKNSNSSLYDHQNDSKTPTFSSSFLNKFKTYHQPKTEDFTYLKAKTFKTNNKVEDEKMSSIRRATLVDKWMEKKATETKKASASAASSRSANSGTIKNTLVEEFDLHDAQFFSSTTTSTSSCSSEAEFSVYSHHPKQKPPRVTCFAPARPKPVKTHPTNDEKHGDFVNSRSRAAKVYSNMKNLKQPISPGIRLTSFINSLFSKDGKHNKKSSSNIITTTTTKQRKTEEIPTYYVPTCSSTSSFSRSCLNRKKEFYQDVKEVKRTVRFCPVSVILDDDSQPCGYKSLQEEERKASCNKVLKNFEARSNDLKEQKKLEEVALDLLSGYWDERLNKSSHDLSSKNKGYNDDYGVNHGIKYDKDEDEDEDEDEDDEDGFSCSSSDLFELDHLSLLGSNELPVYETTQFGDTKKIM